MGYSGDWGRWATFKYIGSQDSRILEHEKICGDVSTIRTLVAMILVLELNNNLNEFNSLPELIMHFTNFKSYIVWISFPRLIKVVLLALFADTQPQSDIFVELPSSWISCLVLKWIPSTRRIIAESVSFVDFKNSNYNSVRHFSSSSISTENFIRIFSILFEFFMYEAGVLWWPKAYEEWWEHPSVRKKISVLDHL